MQNASDPTPVPRLAATVMLVREGADASLEVYLTRRHSRSRFMPDAFVFPGGAVDAGDRAIAHERLRGSAGSAAPELVVAAVRETFEEAGVLLATGGGARLDAQRLATARAAINAGASFGAFLEEHALTIDGAQLAYYSNWITPQSEPIRFDAHFFIARAPADQIAAADAREVHDGMWLAPQRALAQSAAREMTIRFPTQKHLERLARYTSVDELLAATRARNVSPVRPTEIAEGVFSLDEHAW